MFGGPGDDEAGDLVDAFGRFLYHPNNGNKISRATKKQIGSSWDTWKHVTASDFTGDGYADIIGVNSSGKLWVYPQAGGKISSTMKKHLGHGWDKFKHVM